MLFPIDGVLANSAGITNEKINEMNREIVDLCKQRPRCTLIDTADKLMDSNGGLARALHIGDGVHLSPDAYAIWIADLKTALHRLRLDNAANASDAGRTDVTGTVD